MNMTVRYGREAGASVAMVDMTRSGSQACLMEPQKLTAVVIWSGGGQVKILLFSSWHLVYWRPDDFSLISALVYSPRLADISLLAPAIKPNPTTAESDLSSER